MVLSNWLGQLSSGIWKIGNRGGEAESRFAPRTKRLAPLDHTRDDRGLGSTLCHERRPAQCHDGTNGGRDDRRCYFLHADQWIGDQRGVEWDNERFHYAVQLFHNIGDSRFSNRFHTRFGGINGFDNQFGAFIKHRRYTLWFDGEQLGHEQPEWRRFQQQQQQQSATADAERDRQSDG